MKKNVFILIFALLSVCSYAKKETALEVKSPNGNVKIEVTTNDKIEWSVSMKNQVVIAPSEISMEIEGIGKLGYQGKVTSKKVESVSNKIETSLYKKSIIDDSYNQLTVKFKGGYAVVFRAYNDGAAYRFETTMKEEITILDETTIFNFSDDHMIFIPYRNPSGTDCYHTSFENNYDHIRISQIDKTQLAFAPVLVELPNGMKAAITEADLEDYPGMFIKGFDKASLEGDFAPYPLEEVKGGHNDLQAYVTKRANYLAKTNGTRTFPWRIVITSETDKELLNNDMVYKLASPSRIEDTSWIQPGKVAWDWWNDWNISNVDFRAGINTETYKYYIDFAAKYHIENILLDEGWANSQDIMQIVPEIDLKAIIEYATSKGIGVWLWGGWYPLNNKMDEALSLYSKMGIKGFKIDFMDRDDQKMVNFYYRMAKKAAEYKIMIDFHGAYKPTGLHRTYPNVLNYEAVKGLENAKWGNPDFPLYDCTLPFIRQLAGPMDYTPGAMKNANKTNFKPIFTAPMSQGTRCHQLGLYVILEAPFNMLADNPTNYMKEEECTKFIASIPTVFDETVALDGKVSEYAAIARRKGENWYVGAIGNWDPHKIQLDFSFLPEGASYEAEIFKDGINADREATDYKREIITVNSKTKLEVNLSTGGGWAAKITKK